MTAFGSNGRPSSSRGAPQWHLRRLGAQTLVDWSLKTLLQAGCEPVVVVVPSDLKEQAAAVCGRNSSVELVAGGTSELSSVRRALQIVSSPSVVVHDVTRPFLTHDLVGKVTDALQSSDGAICAVPLDETLKLTHSTRVKSTVDRTGWWRAQTPEAWDCGVLQQAHERARSEGGTVRDNAQVVAKYGGSIAVIAGARANIKISSAADFMLAEAMAHSGVISGKTGPGH
ncbi:MAG: 2-C-methyl-D-erythritol 4-phosphate cytidylyltransferase [Actinomycetota bacterium]|nr:2-C-methyl-D-erythritol 4-phosphate cytidylyltransferase [Actinomycetota bacterium]